MELSDPIITKSFEQLKNSDSYWKTASHDFSEWGYTRHQLFDDQELDEYLTKSQLEGNAKVYTELLAYLVSVPPLASLRLKNDLQWKVSKSPIRNWT